jgi:hypothetical protein
MFTVEPDAMRPVGMGRADRSAEAPGEGTFSCVILPPAATTRSRQPRDVVFVLDRTFIHSVVCAAVCDLPHSLLDFLQAPLQRTK